MKEPQETLYVKRTQKDYSLSSKLQIVKEIENGGQTTHSACRKYSIQARSTVMSSENMVTLTGKTKHQAICPKHPNKGSWSWKQK